MTTLLLALPLSTMPSPPVWPEMTLRWLAAVPPMVLPDEPLSTSMPSSALPKPAVVVPAASVPM